jgi:hypothetical protein
LTIWDLRKGEPRCHCEGNFYNMVALIFSPDCKTFASIAEDCTIRIWEAETGGLRTKLGKSDVPPSALAFSADGKLLACGYSDGTIRLWRVSDWKEMIQYTGHLGCVTSMEFSLDGAHLVSGGIDTTVIVWEIPAQSRNGAPVGFLIKGADDEVWDDLGSANASLAFTKMNILRLSPNDAIRICEERLTSIGSTACLRIDKWITDLDDNDYTVRSRALGQLRCAGEYAKESLERATGKSCSLEQRLRIDSLLDRIKKLPSGPALLQGLRSIEVLEGIGSREASDILQRVASHSLHPRLAAEAGRALDRLKLQQRCSGTGKTNTALPQTDDARGRGGAEKWLEILRCQD